jgi:hypothetical protein
MAKKQRGGTPNRERGLPNAPLILVNNSINQSTDYADALSSLIPQSCVYHQPLDFLSKYQHKSPTAISILAYNSQLVQSTAEFAKTCQIRADKLGCTLASITISDKISFQFFSSIEKGDWPNNHIAISAEESPFEDVGKIVFGWLC